MKLAEPVSQDSNNIDAPNPSPGRRVLIYGCDATLLATQKMLFQGFGYIVDAAESQDNFRGQLRQSHTPYSLVVVCHTVPEMDQNWIQSAADLAGAPVYQLLPLTAPTELLKQAQSLIER